MDVAELLVRMRVDLSGLKAGLDKAKAEAASAGSRIQAALDKAAPASKALLKGLTGVAVGMGALGVKAVSMAGQLEQSKVAFTTMLGSAQKADAFLRDLYAFAAKTPFEFEGLQNASRQLLAFGFQAQQIIPMMTAIGNAVAGLGGGAAEIDRVTRALGQMQAKGKVSAEEMMQLAELGIPAWEILAEKIGTDIPTAMKKASQGAIPASVAIQGLIEGMNKRFPNMMEKQSSTILGMWSTLKDNLSMSLTSIGNQLIETFDLKTKLAGAIEFLSNLTNLIQEKGLKQALAELIPPDLQTKIVIVAGAIAGALVPALYSMAAGIIAATIPLLPFIAAGAALAGLAFVIYKNWGNIKEFFAGIFGSLKEKAGAAVSWVTERYTWLKNKLGGIWQGIKDGAARAWEGLKNAAKAPINALIRILNALIRGLNRIHITVPDWVSKIPGFGWLGGKSFGFNIKEIPTLATGGVFTRPSLAVLAETPAARPEIVTPEPLLRRIVREESGNGGIVTVVVPVYLDGKQVARIITPYIDTELARRQKITMRALGVIG